LARSVVRSTLLAVVGLVLAAGPAFSQTLIVKPSPVVKPIPKAPPPWTYYMAIATIAIAALTLLAAFVGYMMQAPGFRRKTRPGPAA
jgi:hypothetical protein